MLNLEVQESVDCGALGHSGEGDPLAPVVFWGDARAWVGEGEVIACREEVLSSGRLSIVGEGAIEQKVPWPLWVAILCKISRDERPEEGSHLSSNALVAGRLQFLG